MSRLAACWSVGDPDTPERRKRRAWFRVSILVSLALSASAGRAEKLELTEVSSDPTFTTGSVDGWISWYADGTQLQWNADDALGGTGSLAVMVPAGIEYPTVRGPCLPVASGSKRFSVRTDFRDLGGHSDQTLTFSAGIGYWTGGDCEASGDYIYSITKVGHPQELTTWRETHMLSPIEVPSDAGSFRFTYYFTIPNQDGLLMHLDNPAAVFARDANLWDYLAALGEAALSLGDLALEISSGTLGPYIPSALLDLVPGGTEVVMSASPVDIELQDQYGRRFSKDVEEFRAFYFETNALTLAEPIDFIISPGTGSAGTHTVGVFPDGTAVPSDQFSLLARQKHGGVSDVVVSAEDILIGGNDSFYYPGSVAASDKVIFGDGFEIGDIIWGGTF